LNQPEADKSAGALAVIAGLIAAVKLARLAGGQDELFRTMA
jgi:hypothetical protein